MATKTQTTTDSSSNSSTEDAGRIRRVLHRLNNSPTFEIWLGIALMYADVIAVTMLHSWNMAWAFPIGVYFLVSGVGEKLVRGVGIDDEHEDGT